MASDVTAQRPERDASPAWQDGLINWRNGLIASPRFQRWAAGSWLTKFVAKRRAKALFDLCAGFVYSQILLACVRLRLFESLADGPKNLDRLADEMRLTREAALRLLRAAAALQLVRHLPGDRFALDDLGASLIGNPSVADFIEHHAMLYDDLRDPVALLRGETETQLSQFWPYSGHAPGAPTRGVEPGADADAYATYSQLMSRSQALVAQDILDAYPLHGHRCLLDAGGGEGAFLSAVAARAPSIRLMLFDLPPVADRARAAFAAQGLDRAQAIGGDFLNDPLPHGADVISVVRIIHDHDDASALALLRAAHAALPSRGVLLLAEPMAGADGAASVGDAYFGFYLLAMGRGKSRNAQELHALLRAAGFDDMRTYSTRRPLLTGLITATRR